MLRAAGAGLTVTVGLAGLSTPVAAEQGAIFDFFEDGDGDGDRDGFTRWSAAARAGIGRIFADDEKRDATEAADDTVDVFNTNASTLVEYANDRLTSSREKTEYDVIRVRFETKDGGDATRWIVADVDDANTYTSASMTSDEPDRDVDHWVRLEDLAAVDAPDELERFVDDYAEPGKAVDARLEGRLAGRYGPDVETSLM